MKVFSRLGWFFKEEKRTYFYGVGALFLVSLLQMIFPMMLGKMIDNMSAQELSKGELIRNIVLLVLISILLYGLRYLWRIFIWGGAFKLEKKFRSKLFRHYMKMDDSFFQKRRVGDLMAHATNDLTAIQEVAGMGVLTFADSIMTGLTTLIAMMVFVDARLTFLSVLPLPLLALLSNRLGEWMHDAFKEAQATFSELTSKVQESISGIKAIIAFGREKEDIQDFEKHLEKIKKSYTRVNLVDSLFDPLIGIIVGLSYALAIFLGGMYVANHTISIGQLVSFFSYINMLVWPLFSFGYLFNIIQRGNASLTRVEELLEAESLVNDDGVEIAENGGSLQVSVNQFSYPDASQKVLENIHFTLPYGQTLGIVGSTGSGKSTLLKQILRLYENFEGEIRYQGKNIFSYTMESYLRQIAYVPQDHQLFSGTIMENIRFGSCDATVEEVIQQAKQASIHDEIMEFPGGYQTLIGERGITLSGGQKQRISIARALLRGGSLVIMDDALSAVDAKTEENLLNKLEVGEKKSLILVAHRLSSVMKADQILVLRDGEIVQRGTHDALVQQDGWYQETWNLQKMQKGGV